MADDTVTDRDDDLATCRRALDELVSAIVQHDSTPRPRYGSQRFEIVPFEALLDTERMAFKAATSDPIRAALRLGIRRVGQQIYRLGGMDALHDAFERVAMLDAANEGRRMSIIDSAFNSVGSGDDRWWS